MANNLAKITSLEKRLQQTQENVEVYKQLAEYKPGLKLGEEVHDISIPDLQFNMRSFQNELNRLREIFDNTNKQIADVQSNLDMFKADHAVDLDSINYKIQSCTTSDEFNTATAQ